MNDSTWSVVTTKLVLLGEGALPNRSAFGLRRLVAIEPPVTGSCTLCHSGLPNRFFEGADWSASSNSGAWDSTTSSRSRRTPLPRNPLKGFILARMPDVSPLEVAADNVGGANKFGVGSSGLSGRGFLFWDSGNASLARNAGGPLCALAFVLIKLGAASVPWSPGTPSRFPMSDVGMEPLSRSGFRVD